MKCSPLFRNISGKFHGLAIMVTMIFSYMQIDDIQSGGTKRYFVPLGLALMMLLRIPNTICIALNDSHGWFIVLGSFISLIVNSYIAYLLINEENKDKKHNKKY